MIDFIIPILASYFRSGIAAYYLFPIIALGFVSFVPALVNYIVRWRD